MVVSQDLRRGREGSKIRTIIPRNLRPDPARILVNHNIPNPIFPPLPQQTSNLPPSANFADLETHGRHRRFDSQEPRQPILMRLDGARRTRGDVRKGREGRAGVEFGVVWGEGAGHEVRGRIGGGGGERGGRVEVVVCGV